VRILILGIAEVGKSTLSKQIRILHCEKFTNEELSLYKRIAIRNIHSGVLSMISMAASMSINMSKYEPEISAFRDSNTTDSLDQAKLSAAKILFASQELQNLLKTPAALLAEPHLQFFLSRVESYAQPDYTPTKEDILRLRQRTIGSPTLEFQYKNRTLQLVDLGGQEVERTKWPLLAEDATALIFLASLTHYDTPEDKSKSRLQESLETFNQVAHDEAFAKCFFCLFLNKWDLFQEQIKFSPFTKAFPKFSGDANDTTACGKYVEEMYRAQLEGTSHRSLIAHFTTATDTNVIDNLFASLVGEILHQNMAAMGFM